MARFDKNGQAKFWDYVSQIPSFFSAAGENFKKKGQKCGNVEKGEKKGRGGQKRGKTP